MDLNPHPIMYWCAMRDSVQLTNAIPQRRARAGHKILSAPQLASRERKIVALKARIATGHYRVSNKNLARALLKAW